MQLNVLRLPAGNMSGFHISGSWHRTAVACHISPVSDMDNHRLRLLYCGATMRKRRSALRDCPGGGSVATLACRAGIGDWFS